jgi:hypothetical protein
VSTTRQNKIVAATVCQSSVKLASNSRQASFINVTSNIPTTMRQKRVKQWQKLRRKFRQNLRLQIWQKKRQHYRLQSWQTMATINCLICVKYGGNSLGKVRGYMRGKFAVTGTTNRSKFFPATLASDFAAKFAVTARQTSW